MTSVKKVTPGGYMTVYLALTVTVIMALCLALIEGCRYRGISLETECVMDIGMDSILAEYHRELQKQYNLFAIDCSYGTESASTKLTESHLLEYMNRNFSLEDVFLEKLLYRDFFAVQAEEAQAVKAAFLTDGEGEVFRRVAVDAIEDTVGIGLLQQLTDWLQVIESRGLEQQDIAGQKQQIDAQIQEYDGKDKTVVNIAGDGCFRMNMNEVATATRYNIPIIEVIFNNHVLGMVRQWQDLFYGKRYSATVLDDQVDFVKVSYGSSHHLQY